MGEGVVLFGVREKPHYSLTSKNTTYSRCDIARHAATMSPGFCLCHKTMHALAWSCDFFDPQDVQEMEQLEYQLQRDNELTRQQIEKSIAER